MNKFISFLTVAVFMSLSHQSFGQATKKGAGIQDSTILTIRIYVQFTVKPTGKFENVKTVGATCDPCDIDTLGQERINELKREAGVHVLRSEGHYQAYDHDTTLVEPRIFVLPKKSLIKKTKPNKK